MSAVESKGWGVAIRSVLDAAVFGRSPDDWQLSWAAGNDAGSTGTGAAPGAAPAPSSAGAAAAANRALLQSGEGSASLATQWRRMSATPSLDAWRLGQPGPAGSPCATQLCWALVAAGVGVDPSAKITIDPDPSAGITQLRGMAQMEVWKAAQAGVAAGQRQARVNTIVGASVGGAAGLVALCVAASVAARRAAAARAARRARAAEGAGGAKGGGASEEGGVVGPVLPPLKVVVGTKCAGKDSAFEDGPAAAVDKSVGKGGAATAAADDDDTDAPLMAPACGAALAAAAAAARPLAGESLVVEGASGTTLCAIIKPAFGDQGLPRVCTGREARGG